MKYIQRKTNVRRHDRRTKHKIADVRRHERNIKARPVLGTIPLKRLNYPQAKTIFPILEPYGDIDEDRVINKRDCRPFDVDEQDEYDEYPDDIAIYEDEKRREEVGLKKRNPYGDEDNDGVCNKDDCEPFNPARQDKEDWGKSLKQQGDLDPSIKPVLTKLNKAGYKTLYSCSGLEKEHSKPVKEQPYIVFKTKNEKQKAKIEQAAKNSGLKVSDTKTENLGPINKIVYNLTGEPLTQEIHEHPLGADIVVRGNIRDSDEEKIKEMKGFEKELIN